MCFGFDEIVTDLREDAPVGEIVRYADYSNRCCECGLRPMNYHSWLHGAPRHTEAEFRHAADMMERQEKPQYTYDNDNEGD